MAKILVLFILILGCFHYATARGGIQNMVLNLLKGGTGGGLNLPQFRPQQVAAIATVTPTEITVATVVATPTTSGVSAVKTPLATTEQSPRTTPRPRIPTTTSYTTSEVEDWPDWVDLFYDDDQTAMEWEDEYDNYIYAEDNAGEPEDWSDWFDVFYSTLRNMTEKIWDLEYEDYINSYDDTTTEIPEVRYEIELDDVISFVDWVDLFYDDNVDYYQKYWQMEYDNYYRELESSENTEDENKRKDNYIWSFGQFIIDKISEAINGEDDGSSSDLDMDKDNSFDGSGSGDFSGSGSGDFGDSGSSDMDESGSGDFSGSGSGSSEDKDEDWGADFGDFGDIINDETTTGLVEWLKKLANQFIGWIEQVF